MVISGSSTFDDVLAEHPVAPNTDDVEKWSTVNLSAFNEDNGIVNTIKLGVFGWDMVPFLEDCIIATDANCDYAKVVDKWDGWALGVFMEVAYDSVLDTLSEGVCMPDFECVGFNVDYTAGTPATYDFTALSWKTYELNETLYSLTSNMPDLTSYTDYTQVTTTGYDDLSLLQTKATTWLQLSTGILFVKLQDRVIPSENKHGLNYQVGDQIDIWSFASLSQLGNEKNSNFVMASAIGAIGLQASILISSTILS